jgi:hypothetical protein
VRSSSTSSRCRIELPGDRHGELILLVAAVLAAISLWLSDVPAGPGILLWLTFVLIAVIEWRRRRRRPQRLILRAPDALRLEWSDGRVQDGTLRQWRRLGPLVLLESDLPGSARLDLWLPALPLNDARELGRQLARMRPVDGASV